jgi:GNAT superfamily N-acetyltransferase
MIEKVDARANWDEVYPLMAAHWAELYDTPFKLDTNTVEAAMAANLCRLFVAREDDKIIGYALYLLSPALFNMGTVEATEMGVFIDPEYRKGSLAVRLLSFADRELLCEGISDITYHVPQKNQRFGKLLEHRGFKPSDTIFKKVQPCQLQQ